jgi:hypothetical protein
LKTITAILIGLLFLVTSAPVPMLDTGAHAQSREAPKLPQKWDRQRQQTPMRAPGDEQRITVFNSCEECNGHCSYGACFLMSSGVCFCVMCSNCDGRK